MPSVGAVIPIGVEMRAAVIEAALDRLIAQYVFPAVAEEIAASIRGHMAAGDYDAIADAATLCIALTTDLQAVNRDGHLLLLFRPEPRPRRDDDRDSAERQADSRARGLIVNFGFEHIERLAGNVGYLDLRGFYPPEMAGETAAAAMRLLSHTHALIIDLRHNRGGNADMVAQMCGYLLGPEPVHLNTFHYRLEDRIEELWTPSACIGPCYTERPVYLLTSHETISAGEMFAYDLKHLSRAIIVGETTHGAANPGGVWTLHDHIELFIPTARCTSPVTGTNWEGAGVSSDIAVPQEKARETAHRHALERVRSSLGADPADPSRALVAEIDTALAQPDCGV